MKIEPEKLRDFKWRLKSIGRKKEKGYIYLVKSNGLYKIGRAKYPRDRIKTYQTENPFGIEIILVKEVDDYIGKETELLEKFKEKRIRGKEWFELNQKDIEWIKQNI